MREAQPQAVSAWWNPKRDLESSFDLIKSSWLNLLLLACPFAIAAEALHWSATTIFLLVRKGSTLYHVPALQALGNTCIHMKAGRFAAFAV